MSEVYRVYALQSGAGKFYIGFSENVTLRVQQHNAGLTRSTRGRGPWKLVWQSDTLKLSDTRRLELDLKRQKSGNGFYQKDWPEKIMKAAPRHGGAAPATNFLGKFGLPPPLSPDLYLPWVSRNLRCLKPVAF